MIRVFKVVRYPLYFKKYSARLANVVTAGNLVRWIKAISIA